MKLEGKEKVVFSLSIAALGIVLYRKIIKAKQDSKKKQKRIWSREWIKKRNQLTNAAGGANNIIDLIKYELAPENPHDFNNYMRMDAATFNLLLSLLEPSIVKEDTVMRQAIPATDRLIATLRYLATGETLKTLALSTRIPHNTLSVIIKEVLMVIVEVLQETYLKVPNTPEEWTTIAGDYEKLWHFPHCIGAMDGKHITFRPFRRDGSFYRNYKNTDSIVLMAVVDANYKFVMVDIGTNGRISDGGVFARSPICTAFEHNTLNLPTAVPLPGREMNVSYVLVADDAFPLKDYIMKPYRFRGLTNEQKIYNYRVSRARRIVESTFGILSNRFQIFLKPMNVSVEKVQLITHSSVILHNFLATTCNKYADGSDIDLELNLTSIPRQTYGNRNTARTRAIREEFQVYFNTNGAVEWQQESVNRHNL